MKCQNVPMCQRAVTVQHVRIVRLQNWRQSELLNPTTFVCHLTEKWTDYTGFGVLTLKESRRPAQIPGASSPGPLNFKNWRLMFPVTPLQFFSLHTILLSVECTAQKAPDKSEVHRPIQNCGSLVRNLLYVAILTPRIWRRFLDFLKFCSSLALLINDYRFSSHDATGPSEPGPPFIEASRLQTHSVGLRTTDQPVAGTCT